MNIHTKPADKGGSYLAYVFKHISVQLLPEQRPQWTQDTHDREYRHYRIHPRVI